MSQHTRYTTLLALAGLARWRHLDRLTVFADNLVPDVLRCGGGLVHSPGLAAHIGAGRPLRPGSKSRARWASGRPAPASATAMGRASAVTVSVTSTRPPGGVAAMAFCTRLLAIRQSRPPR